MAGTEAALTRLRELFRPTLDFLGYELYDLKLTGSGGHPTLLVAIDRPQGVSLDDCEKVSKSLSALLDQADPLPTRYDLEVSSPGAERPLRTIDEYRRFLGRRANIRYRMGESERVAEGRLLAVSSEQVELRLRDSKKHEETVTVPFPDILAARLAVDL
ncbi:MAG: ribosome maturation factor RimP [Chloroflexi bacterium]|nr:MAG: ribosome maturation factor RimP [Chloroflexota bacterium]TMG37367.1 MAG: ribosome maturation factor RimP [Chloroflexota bacterium]